MTPLSAPKATPERMTLAGAADAITAAHLRRALQRWLQQMTRASADMHDDIVLGVNEALANCVEHAYRGRDGVGAMRMQADYYPAEQSIRVCVSDRGTWRSHAVRDRHDPLASRGIMLMHALADHCSIDSGRGGTTVCLDYTAN
jgi:serine/threonine-protein kinase RsbW